MNRVIKWCVAGVCCFSGVQVVAENYGESMEWVSPSGGVNWSKGQVVAEGVGVPPEHVKSRTKGRVMACRAAVVDAQRNLLETTKGVRVQSETLVENYMLKSDRIQTRVEGIVKGAMIKSRQIESDGTCVVKMAMFMSGQLASTVYQENYSEGVSFFQPFFPKFSFFNEAHAAVKKEIWVVKIDDIHSRLKRIEHLVKTNPQIEAKFDKNKVPTGLVIDARGSNFLFSMSPNIRQLRGGKLYPNKVNKVDARKNGRLISLFMSELDAAKKHPRVGENPLTLKALRTYGKTRTDIVLGKTSSKKLNTLIKKGFLENAEVIIVMN